MFTTTDLLSQLYLIVDSSFKYFIALIAIVRSLKSFLWSINSRTYALATIRSGFMLAYRAQTV
ncbi:MAG: hypothetical protein HC815_02250 [Richelia sp. RM1_1_1]|nr:hypothetical protein [Richelia sp. RM1_1_1]